MPTAFLSDQQIATRGAAAAPPKKLRATEAGGKVTRALFSATLPASGLVIGDSIQLVRVPSDVAIVGGLFSWDRGQGEATTSIGIGESPDEYFTAAVTPTPAVCRFAETQAQHHGTVLSAEEILIATNGAAAWVAGSTIKGYVEIVGA